MIATMKAMIVSAALAASCSMLIAQVGPVHYSHSQLRQIERSAHTAQQYEQLAAYFRGRAQEYHGKADGEMEEWVRRMPYTMSLYAKYPTPADSSRNRYEYFRYEQTEMNRQAAHYEVLASVTHP